MRGKMSALCCVQMLLVLFCSSTLLADATPASKPALDTAPADLAAAKSPASSAVETPSNPSQTLEHAQPRTPQSAPAAASLPASMPSSVVALPFDEGLAQIRAQLEAAPLLAQARAQEEQALRQALRDEMQSNSLTTVQADARYQEIAELQKERRQLLRNALLELAAPSALPSVTEGPRHAEQIVYLRELENQLRWQAVLTAALELRELNTVRLQMLQHTSPKLRGTLLGLSRAGIAQLLREVADLQLLAGVYLRHRLRQLHALSFDFADIFTWGTVGSTLFKLLLLLWATVFLRRRQRSWLKQLQVRLAQRQTAELSFRRQTVAERWLGFVQRIAGPLLWLLFVYALFGLVIEQRPEEVALLRALLLAHAWYLLLSTALHSYITQAAALGRRNLDEASSQKVLRSVRLTARYGFFVVVILIVSAATLGRGYLYLLVVQFSWLGALPIFLILLKRWRREIETAYLNGHPQGRLVEHIQRGRNKSLGIWAVAVVLVFVLIRALRLYAQDTLSRFKHTRKAFAFVMRRQLERQAESAGQVEQARSALPPELVAAFGDEPATPELALPIYPQLKEAREHLSRWRAGGNGTAIALVGESGTGRSSWLQELQRQEPDAQAVRVRIDARVDTEAQLCAVLCRLLDLQVVDSTEQLIKLVRNGPRRLICLDQCENLVLRSVGGMQAYKAFSDVVGRTVPHLFWLCGFSRYAWEYVESVLLTRNVFRELIHLAPWNAESMAQAIGVRMQAAGFVASFEDLLVDQAEGAERENEILRAEERYHQLLWDYTEGVQRLVLHFWLRSLVVDEPGAIKVRLFEAPSADALEVLSEQSRFMLAAVVIHQSITVDESAKVLNYRPHVCEMLLGHLRDQSLLQPREQRYSVTPHWYRAVIRYLRRKHLLYS